MTFRKPLPPSPFMEAQTGSSATAPDAGTPSYLTTKGRWPRRSTRSSLHSNCRRIRHRVVIDDRTDL
jgi:hypothetical protein